MAARAQKPWTVAIVAGAVVVIVLAYFWYDLNLSPCARISEEVTPSLRANLDLIGKKGEFFLGKRKVEDLSDESQRYVANLRACCGVLQGGKLGADQFLQCKSDAKQHETQVAQIASVINEAQAAQAQGQSEAVKQKIETADRLTKELHEKSAQFAQKIAQLSPDSGPSASSKNTGSPEGASEREPNNDAFNANRVSMGATIAGEIAPADDQDWFVFRADTKLRDWLDVKLSNHSTTLQPCLSLYDANKILLHNQCSGNAGADLGIARVVEPGKDYFVVVYSYSGSAAGTYAFSMTARKAYDAYEPNNDIFSAKPISRGKAIEANIMADGEQDWYVVQGFAGKQLNARLENRSTLLQPCLSLYDSNRTHIADQCAGNASANVALSQPVDSGKDYYVAVWAYSNRTAGDYRLSIDQAIQ